MEAPDSISPSSTPSPPLPAAAAAAAAAAAPASAPGAEKPRQKKFAARSRKGCITCRKRRKRCDEARPACDNCIRVNVCCGWAPLIPVVARGRPPKESPAVELPTTVVDSQVSSEPVLDFSLLLEVAPLPDPLLMLQDSGPAYALTNPLSSDQRFMLTYYIHSLVPTFSVVDTSTVYHLSLYIPMAFQSLGVLNAILACSASHLAKTTVDLERAAHFQRLTTVHQMLCHEYLQKCVFSDVSAVRNSDETISVLMLLISLETHNGSNLEKWQKQLKCAGRIIAARGGPKAFVNSGWESRSVFGHFLYHDVCAMIMNGVQAEYEHQYPLGAQMTERTQDWDSLCPNDFLEMDLDCGLDPLMGLASSLFMKIRQIGRVKKLPYGSLEREQLFLSLETDINSWSIQGQYAPGKAVHNLELGVQLDLIALAETYKLAAMILLYRTSDMHAPVLPKIAKKIMSYVTRIPNGNQAESGLAFPLFLAGGELVDWEDMQTCAQKLRGVRDRTRIMNIQGVEEVLESVWRAKLNGVRKDWVEVLREEQRLVCVA